MAPRSHTLPWHTLSLLGQHCRRRLEEAAQGHVAHHSLGCAAAGVSSIAAAQPQPQVRQVGQCARGAPWVWKSWVCLVFFMARHVSG